MLFVGTQRNTRAIAKASSASIFVFSSNAHSSRSLILGSLPGRIPVQGKTLLILQSPP